MAQVEDVPLGSAATVEHLTCPLLDHLPRGQQDGRIKVALQCLTRLDPADGIVERHGLRPIGLLDLLGESHHYADFCLAHGATRPPPPAFVSTVKIKQAGFVGVRDTEESFVHWLRVLQDRRILPR